MSLTQGYNLKLDNKNHNYNYNSDSNYNDEINDVYWISMKLSKVIIYKE